MSSASTMAPADAPAAIPKSAFDWKPFVLLLALVAAALPAVGSTSSWLTLTFAGLAMGLIIFVVSSGLTLVFGLMDVLNFGHGLFIAIGAFVATSVMGGMGAYADQGALQTLLAIFAAMLVAMLGAGAIGWAFERVIVRPVYGQHLKQILITMGGMIVGEELIKVIWGRSRSRCRCRKRCAAASCSATRRSRSTACSRWRSGWWCSRCCCGR